MSNIQEIAKQAGVSPATVSRTFRTPNLLSHQTRRRVLDVAERLNYQPRLRNMRSEGTSGETPSDVSMTLGFLFFAADEDSSRINEFYHSMLGGAQAEAGNLGMHLIVRTTPRYERPHVMPQMFREQAVAGTLLVGAALPEVLAAFDSPCPPAVLLDNCNAASRHDCVLSDGFGGVSEGTRYLLGLGHRRIAFVYNEPTAVSFLDRKRGYLCALWEAGVEADPSWVVSATRFEPLEPHLIPLLAGPNRPTAIIAANDLTAFKIMSICREQGLSVPEDISILGYDDISFCVHSYPPLTTLRVDTEYMGRLAVRRLLSRIEECSQGKIPLPPIRLTVPVKLIERETCTALRS